MKRPPIITILGHVDHGKTSLLDAIRHTKVTASETGGITQHIGAYQITHHDQLITFIDTPGHAAFSAMRSRGGRIADIAVLVIAADDGVMPQTKESIEHIKAAGIPFLVAITKIDLPEADPQKLKAQLAENEVLVEGFGGNVPVVEVSAKAGTGLDQLLETLLIMADLEELAADPTSHLEAIVIESRLDKRSGPLATLIVTSGTLKPQDHILALTDLTNQSSAISGKVRSLTDWNSQNQTQVLPSTPTQVLGFTKVPPVGSLVTDPQSVAKLTTSPLSSAAKAAAQVDSSLDIFKIILKSDVTGTLEAILDSLPPTVQVLSADTGPINESDILLAETTGSSLLGFRVQATTSAQKLAAISHIDIFTYATIYDLLEDLPKLIQTAKDRAYYELELARLQVIKAFDIGGTQVIGAAVVSGSVTTGESIRLLKNGNEAAVAKITSLRIGRADQDKVKKGQECGLVTDPPLAAASGDTLVVFKIMKRGEQ